MVRGTRKKAIPDSNQSIPIQVRERTNMDETDNEELANKSDSENMNPALNKDLDDASPVPSSLRRSSRLSTSTAVNRPSLDKGKQKVIYKEDSTDFEDDEEDDMEFDNDDHVEDVTITEASRTASSSKSQSKKRSRKSISVSDEESGSDFQLDEVVEISSDDDEVLPLAPVTSKAIEFDDDENNAADSLVLSTNNDEAVSPQSTGSAVPIARRQKKYKSQALDRDDVDLSTTTSSKSKKVKIPDLHELHPELEGIWDRLREENDQEGAEKTVRAEQPADVNVKLLPFQLEGLHWMLQQEEGRFKGGILADEMGMGKTIQTIALLVSRKVKPNLILCPTVAMMQWMGELANRTTEGTFKVLMFHGNNRPKRVKDLEPYDIILSTYSIVEQGFRKQTYGTKRKGELVKERSLLHTIEWGRVILDEAHAIKDRSCSTARAVFALKRKCQWSLTGTPLQNRVGELYSIIRFLNADPFSFYFCRSCDCKLHTWKFSDHRYCDECGHSSHRHFCWWNAEILKPIQKYGAEGDGLIAFQKLGLLLDRIMLRRTKVERTEELGLPPRIVTVRSDVFNAAEEELYESLYTDTARTFNTYVAAGTVLNNYASIFSLLSRMRLAVNHPDLVTTRLALEANTATTRLVCGICHEQAEDAILSQCKHVFCREDARQFLQSAPAGPGEGAKCPVCFKKFNIDLTQPEMEVNENEGSAPISSSIVNHIDLSNWRSSTKIEALVEELSKLHNEDHTIKSIVFSQFVSFLDLIQWRLSRAGFQVVKLDGRMGPAQRETVIQKFMTDPYVTVFLVSLKAGGVALNLTEASHVFICDPWWNPASEDQAFDRIHRLGQYRPIKITRLIIENSIESRIIELQEKKKALFESTVGKDMNALAKLSEDDLRFLFVL